MTDKKKKQYYTPISLIVAFAILIFYFSSFSSKENKVNKIRKNQKENSHPKINNTPIVDNIEFERSLKVEHKPRNKHEFAHKYQSHLSSHVIPIDWTLNDLSGFVDCDKEVAKSTGIVTCNTRHHKIDFTMISQQKFKNGKLLMYSDQKKGFLEPFHFRSEKEGWSIHVLFDGVPFISLYMDDQFFAQELKFEPDTLRALVIDASVSTPKGLRERLEFIYNASLEVSFFISGQCADKWEKSCDIVKDFNTNEINHIINQYTSKD